ncbi:DinB family protein [bacterium]|nr:DinB family protein [bacterium]
MTGQDAAGKLRQQLHFFNNVADAFAPGHGDYRPTPEMMTVSQQINHVAHTTRWFRTAIDGEFDMDFERFQREYMQVSSLAEARDNLTGAYEDFAALVSAQSEAWLLQPLPENRILGPAPRLATIAANADHTAHHRGALSVYLRLLGIAPKLVYAP